MCKMCCGSVGCVRCVVGVWDVLGELWDVLWEGWVYYVECHFTMQLFKQYMRNCFNVGFQLFSIGQKKLNQERYVYQTV